MTPNEIAIIITRAAKAMGATVESMMTGQTDHQSATARRLAFYYMFTHGQTIENIAQAFKMGDDTVKRGINKIKYSLEEYKTSLTAIDGREV